MLARIRDIRASEKRFYQKVRDLFALSVDYDKTDRATQTFFATVQNLLLYAVTQRTAAELIIERANADDPHFGLRRSEEHTSELQSLMRISYAVFCLKKQNTRRCT